MKKTFLFPTCFRKIGWIISIVTLLYFVIGVIFFADKFDFNFKMPAIVGLEKIYNLIPEKDYFVLAKTSFMATLFPVLMIIGFVFIAFSKHSEFLQIYVPLPFCFPIKSNFISLSLFFTILIL